MIRVRAALILLGAALLFSACAAGWEVSGGGAHSSANADTQGSAQRGDTDRAAAPDAPAPDENGIIRAVVGKNCNYVYHMLSVSGCGYDNAYGAAHRDRHPAADLQLLKDCEPYLTIAGGEYQGDLYFLCVLLPASLDDDLPVTEYYGALADLFATGEVRQNYERYRQVYQQAFSSVAQVNLESFHEFYVSNEPLKREIAAISSVMCKNFHIYSEEVWEDSLNQLAAAAREVNRELADNEYASRWEEILGSQYDHDGFYALLCNSMENGVNCIDVSDTKDVFYHGGDCASTARLISHEFGIYLLRDMLADTGYQGYAYYELTEALAEYYNTAVSGGHTDWEWGADYITYYRQVHDREPQLSAQDLFLRGVEHFLPDAAE